MRELMPFSISIQHEVGHAQVERSSDLLHAGRSKAHGYSNSVPAVVPLAGNPACNTPSHLVTLSLEIGISQEARRARCGVRHATRSVLDSVKQSGVSRVHAAAADRPDLRLSCLVHASGRQHLFPGARHCPPGCKRSDIASASGECADLGAW